MATLPSTHRFPALAERLTGELITPEHFAYDAARSVWNGMIDKRPAAIARCVHADRRRGGRPLRDRVRLALSIRGGGHNVAGTALVDDGLVIDLSNMRGVRLDPSGASVHVQGGATWADVDAVTAPLGSPCPAAWCRRPASRAWRSAAASPISAGATG